MHNSIYFPHTLQIQSEVHDINSMFKKSKMKIVSSFNALFPELLLHEKKKDIRFLAGRVCNKYLFFCVYLVSLYTVIF